MNKIKRTVREADQPVRQSRSAKSSETNPVSRSAQEKKKKTLNRPPGGGAGITPNEGDRSVRSAGAAWVGISVMTYGSG